MAIKRLFPVLISWLAYQHIYMTRRLRQTGGLLCLAMFASEEASQESRGRAAWMWHSATWNENWDGRHPSSPVTPDDPEPRSRANRNIILIRHGQYEQEGNRGLTEKGRQQSTATSRRLLDLHHACHISSFASVLSSTKPRAVESADLIHKELTTALHLPISRTSDKLLDEGSPCIPQPTPEWWTDDDEMRGSVFERTRKDGVQIEDGFRRYFHRAPPEQDKDSYDILVCHGNIIRYFVCRALQLTPEAWDRFVSMAHGSITWIIVKPNGLVHLQSFNDSGHLPPEMLTD